MIVLVFHEILYSSHKRQHLNHKICCSWSIWWEDKEQTEENLQMQLISVVLAPGEVEISCLCPLLLFLGVTSSIPSLF